MNTRRNPIPTVLLAAVALLVASSLAANSESDPVTITLVRWPFT